MNFSRLAIVAAIAICLSSLSAGAQIGGLFNKVKSAASGVGNASWKPGAAITTSIKDSLPAFRIISDSDFHADEADTISSFSLGPGYYRTTIRSYCLHAGAYGSSKGNGYQIARLKGNQATLIGAILERSGSHPEIAQADIQMLIWGIESGQKYTDYPADFQNRIKPLLTDQDIVSMQVKISSLTEKLLPSGLKEMANTYGSIRDKMNRTQMNYDDIEAVAVKAGVPPTGLGSVEIKKGLWSYIGDGFFIRVFPENYSTTQLEIYRPGHFVVKKDDKGRIISYTRGNESVRIEYDDDPGASTASNTGRPNIPVWRIRKFAYANDGKHISEEVSDKGWILRGTQDQLDQAFAAAASGSGTGSAKHGPMYQDEETMADPGKQSISWSDLYARYKDAKSKYSDAKEAVDWAKRIDEAGKLKDYDEYLNEKAAQERIDKGLKAALNPIDFKKKADWIYDLLKMNRDLMYWIDCQLAGTCNDNNDPATPGLPGKVGQPGDSGAQRLGLSPVKKLQPYKP